MNESLLLHELLVPLALASEFLALLLLCSRSLWLSVRRGDPAADAAWLTGSEDVGPAGTELIARYLRRVRRHRFNGAVLGGGLALMRGLSLEGSISIGIGPGSPLTDLLFGGLVGLIIGSVMAETWRVKPAGTVRRAEVAPRSPGPPVNRWRQGAALFTVLTVGLALASREFRPLVLAATSLVLLLAHWIVLCAVADRGRPALPTDLRRADDSIRRFASLRLSVETLAAAVLLAGWQLVSVERRLSEPLVAVLAGASAVGTVFLLYRSRPWPPRRRVRARTATLVS